MDALEDIEDMKFLHSSLISEGDLESVPDILRSPSHSEPAVIASALKTCIAPLKSGSAFPPHIMQAMYFGPAEPRGHSVWNLSITVFITEEGPL